MFDFCKGDAMVNLAIVDSQQIFREGLHRLIESEGNFSIIASESELSSIDRETINQVNLILIDINILRKELSYARKHIFKNDDIKVIALSTSDEQQHVKDAMLFGCDGFFLKEMSYESFIDAIVVILEGGNYIHPKVLHYILSDYRELIRISRHNESIEITSGRLAPVCTSRENEILQLLVNGNDNNSIAEILEISEKTV